MFQLRCKNIAQWTLRHKSLTIDNINPHARKMEYAVRGPIVTLATELAAELKQGKTHPFDKVLMANVGDCHACGQKPISFIRQLVAACTYPSGLLNAQIFPADVISRAETILSSCGGSSLGSYSPSSGLEVIRRHVAEYIEKRDEFPADFQDIILTNGASDGIKTVLNMCVPDGGPRAGVMIPIPQYPLYSATLTELNLRQINYYLDEEKEWALTRDELERSFAEASQDCTPRAIVVINPGNPTGAVLDKSNVELVVDFARQHNLAIFADEVYQQNVYAENSEFYSFKKVLREMGPEFGDVELFSFMSCSKGFMGECGARGGFFEMCNIDPQVAFQIQKSFTARLCCTVFGQVVIDSIVNPPVPGEPSYELFSKEKEKVLNELKEKSILVTRSFQSTENMSCVELKGAMYSFPRIYLPDKVEDEAKKQGLTADGFYCFEMLKNTGVCLVPGSGFGQKPGTLHFRTTILQDISVLPEMLEKIKRFHLEFISRYS